MPGRRVLICGPVFPDDQVGGLQLALDDVASGLRAHGWDVDLAVTPKALSLPHNGHHARVLGLAHARWARLPRLRSLPDDARTVLQHVLLDGGLARVQSDLLRALGRRMRERHYDVVIATVQREAPGLARFITEAHPHAVILSLNGLGGELRRSRWLPLPRFVARATGRRWIHPSMYRPVDVTRVKRAVFASETWRQEAVAAGFPAQLARTIYFGLRDVRPLSPPRPAGDRLLWVGRLSREKGLHHFLNAMPIIARRRQVLLTAVCGQGPADYRQQIERQIAALGLEETVRLLPPVRRDDLQELYRTHDVLLFNSIFAEPVALVVAEAFAAGLPVVASAPGSRSALIMQGETAVCFNSADPECIADAVMVMLEDEMLRRRIRTRAHALVAREFSLDRMAAAYDATLEELLNAPATSA